MITEPLAAALATQIDPDRAAFYAALGWSDGRVEVIAGTNQPANPDKIDLLVWNKATFGNRDVPHTRQWCDSANVTALDRHVERLIERWGNVYVSVGTYGEEPNPWKPGMRHSRNVPLPRYGFILDDVVDLAALPLPPTWATETSPGNHQVGYTCTTVLSPAWAAALGQGAMWRTGADPSGYDAQQLIRVPGSLNTKYKCAGRAGDPKAGIEPEGWTVRLVVADGPRYAVETLAATFLPDGMDELHRGGASGTRRDTVSSHVEAGDEAQRQCDTLEAQAALWRPLVRSGRGGLLADDGHPRAFTNLQGTARKVWDGAGTGDESRDVFIVAKGLLLHGYDDAQAFALLEHFAYKHRPHYILRGAAQVRVDIARVLWKVDAELGDQRQVRRAVLPADAQPQAGPTAPRTRPKRGPKSGGRNAQVAELHNTLAKLPADSDGCRRTTRGVLADALHVSTRLITKYLPDLAAYGWTVQPGKDGIVARLEPVPDVISFHPGTNSRVISFHPGTNSVASPDVISFHPGTNSSADGIGTRNSAGSLQGDHTPPVLCPPLVALAPVLKNYAPQPIHTDAPQVEAPPAPAAPVDELPATPLLQVSGPLATDERIGAVLATLPAVWGDCLTLAEAHGVSLHSLPPSVRAGTGERCRWLLARRIVEATASGASSPKPAAPVEVPAQEPVVAPTAPVLPPEQPKQPAPTPSVERFAPLSWGDVHQWGTPERAGMVDRIRAALAAKQQAQAPVDTHVEHLGIPAEVLPALTPTPSTEAPAEAQQAFLWAAALPASPEQPAAAPALPNTTTQPIPPDTVGAQSPDSGSNRSRGPRWSSVPSPRASRDSPGASPVARCIP